MFKLLILCGSLRAASSSAALICALKARMSDEVDARDFDIGRLPYYNADISDDKEVEALRNEIANADGVLFVTPEYNYSIPGVLKNAIDWASRPAYASVFKAKRCCIITVSGGALGGVRAQAHLKYILNGVLADVFSFQEIVVPHAPSHVIDGEFRADAVMEFACNAIVKFIQHKNERS